MTTKTGSLGTHITVAYSKLVDPGDNVRAALTDIDQLANDIALIGLLQPITVEELTNGKFSIVSGFRRHAAIGQLIAAKRWSGPVAVHVTSWADEAQRVIAMLIENLSRVDLNCVDEALGIQRLAVEHGLDAAQIAERLHRSVPHVKERLALCALPDNALDLLRSGEMTIGVGAALAKAPADLQACLCAKPDYRVGSVRAVESEISGHKHAQHLKSLRAVLKEFNISNTANIYNIPAGFVRTDYNAKVSSAKKLRELLAERGVNRDWLISVRLDFAHVGEVLLFRPITDAEREAGLSDAAARHADNVDRQAVRRSNELAKLPEAVRVWAQTCDALNEADEQYASERAKQREQFDMVYLQTITAKELTSQLLLDGAQRFAADVARNAQSNSQYQQTRLAESIIFMGWDALDATTIAAYTPTDWSALVMTNAKTITRAAAWEYRRATDTDRATMFQATGDPDPVVPLPPLPAELVAFYDGDAADYELDDVEGLLWAFTSSEQPESQDDDDNE